jgi:autotransporter-associated beta strand protein
MHTHAPSPAALRLAKKIAALGTALFSASLASAVDYYKANNETNLELAASWEDAAGVASTTAPVNSTSSSDVLIWDSRVTTTADLDLDGLQEVTVGSGKDLGINTLRVLNPALPIFFNNNARTFTTTTNGGVDMDTATVDLTLSNVFYRIASSSAVINMPVATGRTLTFTNTAQVTVRSNASNVTVNLNNDGASAGTVIFNGPFAPSHVVIGAGRVEFNNLTGNTRLSTNTTTINGGTMLVNNTSGSATGSGTVAVNSGSTLGGSGIISGIVTAAAGSTLTPGTSGIGTLRVGSLILSPAVTEGETTTPATQIIWEANNSVDADLLNVSGSDGLTINGGVIRLYNPGTTEPFTGTGVFNLIAYSGAIGGAGLDALTIDEATKISGRTYTLGLGAGVITLEIEDGTITPIDWNVNASGTWSTGSNWTGGAAPDAVKALARITGATGATLTSPATVTLDAPRTVGKLYLESAHAVTLDGASTLTFDQGPGAAVLFTSGANHTINTPLALSPSGLTTTVDSVGQTLTVGNVISGTGSSLVKIGSGTLLLTGDNTYTGNTSVSAGTLQIGDGGTTGSVAGTISTSGILRINRSDALTFSSPISGTGDIEFIGTGTTTLAAANTLGGDVTIAAGSVTVADPLALQNASLTYSSTGGTLTVADPVTALTLGSLAGDRALPLTNSIGTSLALTVGGNGDSTTYSGSPVGTGLTFTKRGSGTLSLSGTHTYSGYIDPVTLVATGTTVSAGILSLDTGANFTTTLANTTAATARILVNGGTLTASSASLISNVSAGLVVASGTANFNAGLANETGSSSGNPFISVTGGTLNASSITLSRGGLSITSRPANGQTANGLYVNGGTVNVTGALGIGSISGSNSSVSARIDSGTVNVGGPLTVGINNTGRWSVLDVNGGALNVADTTSGVLLGSGFAGQVILFVRNTDAVVTTPRIQFGQAALGGKAFLSLSAGSLYVGSGGLVLGSSAPTGTDVVAGQFEAGLALDGGTLGATADWSSPIPMSLNGDISITAADASNVPHTITLSGPAIGLGALTKNGSGTALLTSTASDITSGATVNSGTLGLGGKVGQLIVNTGATFAPQGVLKSDFATTVDGILAIDYNSINTPSVSRIESDSGGITLGAGSSLVVSGTGNLASGTYVILKASTGITGTFANTSLPAGLSLNYAYDDDSIPETPPAVALVGSVTASSPYELWTTSFSLTGNDALVSADPDGDGLINQLEYALQTSPVASTSSAYTVARSGNVLTLTFNHPADASLTYVVEATNDLATAWTPVHTFDPFTNAGSALYTDTADLSLTPRRFLRLKVTPAP